MIPKTIHYCWFGGNPLSELALKCIKSWKENCPDYRIIEWNETNFDLDCCDFVKEAYNQKKWAFVSDYARLKVIYDYGGIYLDTDVQLIKSLDFLLNEKCYFGEETSGYVATGLGFGAEPHSPIIALLIAEYSNKHFILSNGNYDMEPCPKRNTKPLLTFGYKFNGKNVWRSDDFVVYPPEYFCPLDYESNLLNITNKTVSIHLYNASWHSKLDDFIFKIEYCSNKNSFEFKVKRFISLPFRVINKLCKIGLTNSIRYAFSLINKNFQN